MKAEDLMVGDWVYQAQFEDATKPNTGHGWKPVKVTSVPFDKDYFLEPIPITPEILEKNGFKFRSYDSRYLLNPKRKGFWIAESKETRIVLTENVIGGYTVMVEVNNLANCIVHLKHVHQFQHLTRLSYIVNDVKI